MKKLVILSAVAALVAFGWTSGADAKNLLAPTFGGFICTMANDGPGVLADEVNVQWDDLAGNQVYGVKVMCGWDPTERNSKSASTITGLNATGATLPVASFNGAPSITSDADCVASVKGLILPDHPNKHGIAMGVCDGAFTD